MVSAFRYGKTGGILLVVVILITSPLQTFTESSATACGTSSDKVSCSPKSGGSSDDVTFLLQHSTQHHIRADASLGRAKDKVAALTSSQSNLGDSKAIEAAHKAVAKKPATKEAASAVLKAPSDKVPKEVEESTTAKAAAAKAEEEAETAAAVKAAADQAAAEKAAEEKVAAEKAAAEKAEKVHNGTAITFIVIFCIYSVACIAYEIYSRWSVSEETEVASKVEARDGGWDLIKLFLNLFIIVFHYGFFFDQESEGPLDIALDDMKLLGSSEESKSNVFRMFLYQSVYAGSAFTMCTFAFISGVMGGSFSFKSISRLFCATIVCSIVYAVLYFSTSAALEGGFNLVEEHFPRNTWYLISVFAWRLLITPIFVAGDSVGAPRVCVAVLVIGALFCILASSAAFFLMQLNTILMYLWGTVYFGQFYCVGCCLSKKQWTELFENRVSLIIASCALVLLVCLTAFWSGFSWFVDSLCIHTHEQCNLSSNMWHPDALTLTAQAQGLCLATAKEYFKTFFSKVPMIMILVCLMLNLSRRLQQVAPSFQSWLAESGSRSLLGYLLPYFIQLQVFDHPRWGVANAIVSSLTNCTPVFVCFFGWILSVQNLVVFTGRLTGRIFSPILEPVWIFDRFGADRMENWFDEVLLRDLPTQRRKSYFLFASALGISLATLQFIGPVRTAVFLDLVGTAQEPVAKSLVLVVLLPIVVMYSLAVTVLPSARVLVAVVNGFYVVVFAFIAGMLFFADGKPGAWVAWVLYFAAETKGVILMPMIWSVVADVSTSELSKKAYPFIFFVTQLGGIVGSFVAIQVSSLGGEVGLLLIQTFTLLVIAALTWAGCSVLETGEEEAAAVLDDANRKPIAQPEETQERADCGSLARKATARIWEGFEGCWLLVSRPYVFLAFWVSYATLVTRTVMDYENSVLVKQAYPEPTDQVAYMGRMTLTQNILIALITLLGTRQLVEYFNVGTVMLILPITSLCCIILLCAHYSLLASTVACILSSTVAYGLNSPCKEILFVRTSRDIKYKAKSWSEMYGNNLMKIMGAQMNLWVNNESSSCYPNCFHPGATLAVAGAWVGIWVGVVVKVGAKFQQLESDDKIIS